MDPSKAHEGTGWGAPNCLRQVDPMAGITGISQFFISVTLPALPLKESDAFKLFAGERTWVKVNTLQSGELMDSNFSSCVFELEYYCSEKFTRESDYFLIVC